MGLHGEQQNGKQKIFKTLPQKVPEHRGRKNTGYCVGEVWACSREANTI